MYEEKWMKQAIALAKKGVEDGKGGPFAALVIKDGEVIAACTNSVTSNNDPTAHAEVNAIREACSKLGSHQLENCEIYASCEPCPMCLGAIYWARPSVVYYASDSEVAAKAGFDDSYIYEEIAKDKEKRFIPFIQKTLPDAGAEFHRWTKKEDKVEY
ncbi:MAG: nucleoside deaminase [Odoribacter sp.]|nr:nucleoside deaminase [Odoribacter sp.]